MRDYLDLTLIIPDTPDFERDAVATAWSVRGGDVLRLARFWEPPTLAPEKVRVYGNDTFCLVVADKLGLRLLAPPDDLILHVPASFLRRQVALTSIGEVMRSDFPLFVKPVMPKQFAARVYRLPSELEHETRGLSRETAVIQSEVVRFDAECRAFILDGQVVASSVYEGAADVPTEFLSEIATQLPLPSTCVVDAGFISGSGWAFLEANASWGAGLNGCDASLVLPCIERATQPAAQQA